MTPITAQPVVPASSTLSAAPAASRLRGAHPMVIYLALIGGLITTGCNQTPPKAHPTSAANARRPAPAEAACTLETPLKPGIAGSPGHLIESTRNPNGDSQLATVMRTMQADLGEARQEILAGRAPKKLLARHRPIRCSWPTRPEQRNERFDALAQGYLMALEALDDADTANRRRAFDMVLSGCISCHENTCPGPIAAVKALALPPE